MDDTHLVFIDIQFAITSAVFANALLAFVAGYAEIVRFE